MTTPAPEALLAALAECRLLEPEQLADAERLLASLGAAAATADELVRRGWLTRYQADQILEGNVTRPTKVIPDYPVELEAVVMRALEREPDKRFSTAEEMRMALEVWLAGSGPIVSDSDIAAVARSSLSSVIESRRKSIRAAMESAGADELAGGGPMSRTDASALTTATSAPRSPLKVFEPASIVNRPGRVALTTVASTEIARWSGDATP